jgi:gliding motility-associated-like protein
VFAVDFLFLELDRVVYCGKLKATYFHFHRQEFHCMRKTILFILLLFTSLSQAQNFKWAFKAGGANHDAGKDIAVDTNGNFYVLGYFFGTASFDSAGTARTLVSTGSSDIFLVKYNCARVMQWRVKIGSTATDQGIYQYAGIALDPSGNIYITSTFNGNCIFNSTSGSGITLNSTSSSFTDAFLAKYNNQGIVQWAQKIGSTARDEGNMVYADAYGNVFATGSFSGTTTFGSSSGTPPQLTSSGSTDIYIAKYNASGVAQWAKKAGGAGEDMGIDITQDKNGNLFVGGNVSCCGVTSVTFGSLASFSSSGAWDAFVAKCDSSGNWLWVNRMSGTGHDGCPTVGVDPAGNVYAYGGFSGVATFTTTSGSSVTQTSSGGYDLYFCKYNNAGVLKWYQKASSSGDDYMSALTIGDDGNIYMLGTFYNTLTFGTGSTAKTLSSAGGQDICFAKHDSNGVVQWVQKAGGTLDDEGGNIALDKNGDYIITGGFLNSLTFGNISLSSTGGRDIFVAKSAVLSIVTNDASFCGGDSTILKVDSLSQYTYQWKKNGTDISGQTSNSYWASSAGTYYILRTNTSCNEKDSAIFVVTESPKPIPKFIYSDTCLNSGVSFTDQSTVSTGTIISRKWNFGDGDTSTAASIIHPFDSAVNYSVKLISTNSYGCRDSITKNISVNPSPTAGFSFSDICSDSAATFTNQSGISTGSFSSFWTFGDGDTSTSVNPNHKYAAAGTYQVLLEITTSLGCKDTISRIITIHPRPNADFIFNLQCFDSAFTFTNQSAISSGSIVSWSWDFDGEDTSSAQSPAYKFASYGNGQKTVTLYAFSDKGCRGFRAKGRSVRPVPVAGFNYANRCIDSSVSFSNSSSIYTGTLNYKWIFGNGDSSLSSNPSYLYSDTGTYQAKLVAKSEFGCKDSLIKTVTIYPRPLPTFTFANRCLDSAVTFTDQSTSPKGAVAGWNWSFGDTTFSSAKNPVHNYVYSGSKTVKLVAISDRGCRDSTSKSVTISPKPIPSFSFSEKCIDTALSFTDLSGISSDSITGRTWNFGDSTTSSNQNPVHLYSSSGSKSVKLSLVSDKGCRDSIVITVNVHPLPHAGFIFSSHCLDSPITFTDQSSVSTGNLSAFNWKFGDAAVSTTQNPSHLYGSSGNYNTVLTAVSNMGCRDSIQKSVTIFPKPIVAFNFVSRCQDSALNFTDQSNISAGIVAGLNWSFGDSTSGFAQNPNHLYAYSGAKNVKLVAVSDKGCRDSLAKSVNVHPKPMVNFQLKEVCADSAASFSDLSTVAAGTISSWNWSFGDAAFSSSANPSHQYAAWGTYGVKLVTTSNNGCRDSLQKSMQVHPLPFSDFGFSNRCQDSAVAFTDQSSVAAGTLSAWSWNFGDSLASSSSSPSHAYSYPGSKQVSLIVTSAKGCRDTTSKALSIYPVPVTDFSFSNRCIDTAASFTDLSQIVSGSIAGLQWDFGDAGTSAVSNPVHGFAAAGNYQVKLIARSNLNCRDTLLRTIVIHPLPKAEFGITSICQDSNVTFTDQSTISSPDNVSAWLWSFGDGDSISGKNQMHFYDSTGIYKVKLEVVSNHGCRDTIHHDAIVLPWLVGGFGSSDRCLDSAIQFSGKSAVSIGNTIVSRYWDFGDGSSSVLSNPIHQYLSAGIYTVTIRDSSSKGCVDTAVKAISVYPIPVADFTHSNPCSNTGITFTDISTSISDTMIAWKWNFGDGTTDSVKNPVHQYAVFGNYNVRLIATSQHGCRDTVTKTTLLFAVPVPAFSIVNKCADSALVFTDLSTISVDSNVAWNWTFGDGNSAAQRNTSHKYSASGNYQVQLIITSNRNCKDTLVKAATAHPLPVSNFSFRNSCLDTAVDFVNSTTISSGAMQGWSWNFGDAGNSSALHPSHLYPASGPYDVTLTGTSDFGCKDTAVKTITVYPLPVADFSFANRCLDSAVAFTDISSVSNGNIVAWKWNFGDGSFSSSQQASHKYNSEGTYTVTLVITTNHGCQDTAIKQVIIHPLPVPFFSFVNRCQDTAISFTDLSSVVSGNINAWNWKLGDGSSSSLRHPLHQYNTDGNFIVKLLSTTGFGCKDSISKSVTAFPRPSAQYSFTNRCLDSAILFKDQSTVVLGNIVGRLWDFGDGANATTTDPQHQYALAGPYFVKLIVTTDHGCKDSSSKIAVVHPRPSAAFTVTDKCRDSAVVFSDKSTVATGSIVSGLWNHGDGTTAPLTDSLHQYGLSGNYTVLLKIVSDFGCRDSVADVVYIHPLPATDFSYINHCLDTAISLTDISAIDTGTIVAWQWNFGDNSTSVLQNPSHQYATAGVWNVRLVAFSDKGCKSITRRRAVHAFDLPVTDFTFSDKCLDSAVSFRDTSVIGDGTIASWEWSFGDGKYSNLQHPVNLFPAEGDYAITLINVSDHGCRDTMIKTVTIHPLPVAAFNVNNGCEDELMAFSDVSTVTKGVISTWSWDLDDKGISALEDPVFTYAKHGTKKIKLRVITDKGCRDTAEKSIAIYPKPDAFFGSKEVCSGKETPFTDQSIVVNGNITQWTWHFGNGDSSHLQNPRYIYSIHGNFNVSMIAITDRGCLDTALGIVKVFENPVIDFTASVDSGCAALQVDFTDSSKVADGIVNSWEWRFGDGNTAFIQNPVHSYRQPGNYSIVYTVRSSENCVSTGTFADRIKVFQVPVADFIATPDSVSYLDPAITFTDLSDIGQSWTWDFGDNGISTLQHPVHNYADTGRYIVRQVAASDKGCSDTAYRSVFIAPDYTFFIPNSFTPNRDLVNDVFAPGGIFTGIRSYEINIYNRWGQKITASQNIYSSWNGNYDNTDIPCEMGTYLYLIRITDYFGKKKEYSGNIHLIR